MTVNNNILAPRLVALAKDSSLSLYLELWQSENNLNTYKDIINIFSKNDIDLFEKSNIIIREEFRHLTLPVLSDMIEITYENMENVIKNTLRFIGNINEGPGINRFEWGHSHSH